MTWNSKADENVNCWICEHFQRYERGEAPQSCVGECRFPAPEPAIIDGLLDDKNIDVAQLFPVIEDSPNHWCAKFVRTLENNLPPVPPQAGSFPFEACENVAVIPDDVLTFRAAPWNKKTLPGYVDSPEKGIACWNCDNGQANSPTRLNVQCRFNPPSAFPFGTVLNKDFWEQPDFAALGLGTCYWCAKWQRARHDVPTPSGVGWVCAAAPEGIIEPPEPPVDGDTTITAANPSTRTKGKAKKRTAKKTK